jgi:exonuclease-1
LAYLNKIKYVDFVISEDTDILAFGASRVLYKLGNDGYGLEIDAANLKQNKKLNLSNFDQNMFLSACILSGCDYLNSIDGVGVNSAFKLIS